MKVWERIARHTTFSKSDVVAIMNKQDIIACEIENKLNYLGCKIACTNDCKKCMSKYLDANMDNIQLSLF